MEATVGSTPTGGAVMGPRTGDLDPGVLICLIREKGYGGEHLNRLVSHGAGGSVGPASART